MHIHDIENNIQFIQKFKNMSEVEKRKFYMNKDAISILFSLSQKNRASLLLVLSKLPEEYEKSVYDSYIISSLLKTDPFYKLDFIHRFCKEEECRRKIFYDERILHFLSSHPLFLKNNDRYGKEVLFAVLSYCILHKKDIYFYKFLLEIEDLSLLEDWYIENKLLLKKFLSLSSFPEKILAFFKDHTEELTENKALIEPLLKKDFSSFSSFFSHSYLYSDTLLTNPSIQKKMISYQKIEGKKNNSYLFRYMMQKLHEGKNNTKILIHLEKERKKEIEKLLEKDKILKEELRDVIADYFFEDYLENVLKNAKVILGSSLEDPIWKQRLEQKGLNIFLELISILNKKENEQKEYFWNHKNKNYKKIMDDLLKEAKTLSINDIMSSQSKIKDLHKSFLFKIEGVPIIDLKGENFQFFIHKSTQNMFENKVYEPMTSLSLINQNRIESTYDMKNAYIYGFENISAESILHICTSDSFSLMNENKNIIIYKDPTYVKVDTLIKNTDGYNEIVIKNQQDGNLIRPDFLIVYDKVPADVLNLAKKYNVPIVKINKEYYKVEKRERKR